MGGNISNSDDMSHLLGMMNDGNNPFNPFEKESNKEDSAPASFT